MSKKEVPILYEKVSKKQSKSPTTLSNFLYFSLLVFSCLFYSFIEELVYKSTHQNHNSHTD